MTLKDKYYAYVLDSYEPAIEEKLAFEIYRDADDRGGMLDGIDSEIKEEILTSWVELVRVNLNEWLLTMSNKILKGE